MENNFNYTFKKNYPYIETSVLKQKDVNNIISLICSGRLKNFLEFESYGICEYDDDDKKLINTHVVLTDKFNRLRTNVLVFNIHEQEWTNHVYDKMFIFKTNWPKESKYNIVFYNTETNTSSHHPEIENSYDILIQDIMKALNIMHKAEIYKFYTNKIECARNGKFNDYSHEINIDPIIDRYYNTQYGKDKERNLEKAI